MQNPIEEIKKTLLREIESLRDKRGFIRAGLPRFGRLFGRDSLIVAWQLLDYDPEIAKNTLKVLAGLQGKATKKRTEEEPGKILHEEKGYFPWNYYGAVDSTPLFLILAGFFYKKTQDKAFLKKHFSSLLAAVNWIINYGDKDQDLFLEYKSENPQGLFHQGWKDNFEDHLKIKPPVAIVEAQGYQYSALKQVARISEALGDKRLSQSLLKRAKDLRRKFNKKFWMPDKKYFALALDGQKNQRKAITSSQGHLLFTGIIEDSKVDLVVKRLFTKDMWTSYGIRTHSALEPDFDPIGYHFGSVWPHDNWIIAQGLKESGYKKEYFKIKKALLKVYQEIGFLPELYGVVNNKITLKTRSAACHPQAWATGALLNFLLVP